MTSLYEVLKRSKTAPQLAPDMFTALWAKSITAEKTIELSGQVPLSFKANGTPLLDYLISGNTVQNGTPTPDNPIMPQGTGERTGNLCIQFEHGGIQQSAGQFFDSDYRLRSNDFIQLAAGTYTISGTYNFALRVYDTSKNYITEQSSSVWSRDNLSFTISDGFIKIVVANYNTDTYIPLDIQVMLNTGSAPLPYEPYGYKIPISSANTTTPVYLGEVQTTRRVKKLVLTGTEVINTITVLGQLLFQFAGAYTNDKIYGNALDTLLCNGYKIVNSRAVAASYENNYSMTTYNSTNDNRLIVHDDRFTTVDEFKSYLAQQYAAGTPVTAWYILATDTTGIVNEPLMKIGDYADTVSMEQAGVQIPTNNGSTTLDVLTAVKPSNVSIKYRV